MDLGFNQEQEMLRESARGFLEKECPKSLVRQMEKDEKGYLPELWQKIADLGWLGLIIPEEYGGSGQNFLDLCILLEEMGRALLPSPFFSTVMLGALPILAAGNQEQKREFLPKIASGELIFTMALMEPSAGYDANGIDLEARLDKDEYILQGTKLFVPYAQVADYIICVTRTSNGPTPEEGITLFLIEGGSPGIKKSLIDTVADDKLYEVVFENVGVPEKNVLGDVNRGWDVMKTILEKAAAADCALMMGGAQQVLEMSVEYAKTRIQFDRPIGSFQVCAHRTADQWFDSETAKYITYQAAWHISQDIPATKEVSLAKAWVNEAYRRVCTEAHQTHGGLGYTADHDLGLYTRRAKAAELAFGDTDFHLETVAQELGL